MNIEIKDKPTRADVEELMAHLLGYFMTMTPAEALAHIETLTSGTLLYFNLNHDQTLAVLTTMEDRIIAHTGKIRNRKG